MGHRPTRTRPVDRLGGAGGELLEDDRAHEGGERPVRVARATADRAYTGDEVREHGVARSTFSIAARSALCALGLATGYELDTFAKIDGGWYFAERRMRLDWSAARPSTPGT